MGIGKFLWSPTGRARARTPKCLPPVGKRYGTQASYIHELPPRAWALKLASERKRQGFVG